MIKNISEYINIVKISVFNLSQKAALETQVPKILQVLHKKLKMC